MCVFAAVDCPSPNGKFEHPFDCERYYHCRNGVADHVRCLERMLFDRTEHVCKPAEEVR